MKNVHLNSKQNALENLLDKSGKVNGLINRKYDVILWSHYYRLFILFTPEQAGLLNLTEQRDVEGLIEIPAPEQLKEKSVIFTRNYSDVKDRNGNIIKQFDRGYFSEKHKLAGKETNIDFIIHLNEFFMWIPEHEVNGQYIDGDIEVLTKQGYSEVYPIDPYAIEIDGKMTRLVTFDYFMEHLQEIDEVIEKEFAETTSAIKKISALEKKIKELENQKNNLIEAFKGYPLDRVKVAS